MEQKPSDTILLCLSPSPSTARVIRVAAKAVRPGDQAIALYVGGSEESTQENKQLKENIALAKEAGFEIHSVASNDIPLTIAEYARRIHASVLFVGSSPADSLPFQKKSASRMLAEYLPDVDIHVIPDSRASALHALPRVSRFNFRLRDILLVIVIMTAATLLSVWFDQSRFSNANIITIYILAVLITSLVTSHRIYGILAAVLYILLFNFLFIEPRFTLLVYNSEYLMTYLVTIIAAFITGTVTISMKTIARQSAENAYQAKVLLDTSTQLEMASGKQEIVRITCMQLVNLLNRNILFYDGTACSNPRIFAADEKTLDYAQMEKETDAAALAVENRHHTGAFTRHFSDYTCRYYCIYTEEEVFGVIGIDMNHTRFTDFENSIVLSILREFTMALANEQINSKRVAAEIKAENEHLRAGLLRSISHDLRTPLTSIYGNAINLAENSDQLSEEDRRKICRDIEEDSLWLNAQMENILAMTRLENDPSLKFTVENLYDVIEESISHAMPHPDHTIDMSEVSEDQFAEMDAKLIMQVVINLLNNAVKYTPPGSHIRIRTELQSPLVWVSVADDGPGIPEEQRNHIFELFYTGKKAGSDSYRSLGLGLNLCQMILRAHGGTIEAGENSPHGAVFRFSLKAKEISYE